MDKNMSINKKIQQYLNEIEITDSDIEKLEDYIDLVLLEELDENDPPSSKKTIVFYSDYDEKKSITVFSSFEITSDQQNKIKASAEKSLGQKSVEIKHASHHQIFFL